MGAVVLPVDAGKTDWVARAECAKPHRDPDDWFPENSRSWTRHNRAAQAVCLSVCPVRRQCLIFACEVRLKSMDLWGIWAGYPQAWFDDRKKVAEALRQAKTL